MSDRAPLILIAAMTRERIIGRANGLPWNIPDEYRQFLDHVRRNVVVIGRTSYEIFGGDLGESPMVVVSRSAGDLPDAEVRPDVGSAIELARSYGTPKVFCAGGATIYRQALPLADALYLSIVKGDYDGDVRFPDFDESGWRVEEVRDHPEFEFRVYLRR